MPNKDIVIDGLYKRKDFEEIVKAIYTAFYYCDNGTGGYIVVYSTVKSDRSGPKERFATLIEEFLRDYEYTGINISF